MVVTRVMHWDSESWKTSTFELVPDSTPICLGLSLSILLPSPISVEISFCARFKFDPNYRLSSSIAPKSPISRVSTKSLAPQDARISSIAFCAL